MPFYEVNHSHPLTPSQTDHLAASITRIHCTLFTVPSLFANIRFIDTSSTPTYLGGKRRGTNLIFANMRAGPGRGHKEHTELCEQLGQAWKDAVALGSDSAYVETKENKLNAVFVMGTISAGWEGGFMAPEAGKDREWFEGNLGEFRRRAERGDEDLKAMLVELEGRADFKI